MTPSRASPTPCRSVAESIGKGDFVPNGVQGFGVCESMCGYKDICPYYMGKKAPSPSQGKRRTWQPAITRQSVVAGLGTEAALDLDEGYGRDRIVDAPVVRPIVITPSDVPGIRQGGRQTTISTAQLNEIARLTRTLALGDGLVPLIEAVSGTVVPPLEAGMHPNARILKALQALTFDQAATLVRRLSDVCSSRSSPRRPTRRGRGLVPSGSASGEAVLAPTAPDEARGRGMPDEQQDRPPPWPGCRPRRGSRERADDARRRMPKEQPDWVVMQPDPQTGRRSGLYHLKRPLPAIRTLCGLEKSGWQCWPPGLDRPPVAMCCQRCMNVATREVLEGRYEHE